MGNGMNLGAKGVTEFFFLSVPCCLVLVLNQRIEIVTSRCTNYNSVIYISRYRANCQSCHRDVTIWLPLEYNNFNTFTKVDQTQRFTKYFLSICKICNLIVVHIHHLANPPLKNTNKRRLDSSCHKDSLNSKNRHQLELESDHSSNT